MSHIFYFCPIFTDTIKKEIYVTIKKKSSRLEKRTGYNHKSHFENKTYVTIKKVGSQIKIDRVTLKKKEKKKENGVKLYYQLPWRIQ